MGYTNRPFNYTGNLDNQVQHDLDLANENFDILAQAFVNNDPTTGKVKNADTVDGFHASQTPQANTIPVANSSGKLDQGWLPLIGSLYQVEFTANGNWVVPTGVSRVLIIAVAGGGGGAGGYVDSDGNNFYGIGGECGEAFIGIKNVVPGETLTITVGTGGAGGAGNINGAGSNGTNTTILGSSSGNILTLQGGRGGQGYASFRIYGYPSIFGKAGNGYGSGGDGGSGASAGSAGKNGVVRIIFFAF
ncbi:MAG: hypothetical protein LM575_07325 [Caldimicrobium sp.]|nr:hypothetical protein [Caldimicrobium sp.]